MTLKAVILLAPLFGILRGKRYTYKWLSLLIQFYLLEGLTRATTEQGLSQWLATGETVLSVTIFIGAVMFIRSTRISGTKKTTSN